MTATSDLPVPQSYAEAARRAVTLWGPQGAVRMTIVVRPPRRATDLMRVTRYYAVGYCPPHAPPHVFIALGHGTSWAAAFADVDHLTPPPAPVRVGQPLEEDP